MGGEGSPCGACKFLRKRCVKGCVFAPHFCSEEMGAPHFGAIHKVFGASNFSKLLMHLPVQNRYDAVISVLYEAEARLQDPVYGCVSHIYALQQQVANLKEKLYAGYSQLAACSSSDVASLCPEYGYGKQSEMPSLISSSSSDGASLCPEYGYDKQSEMPSLISNINSSSPHEKQYLNPWGDLQQIPSDNITINNYNEEAREDESSWNSFPVCMQGGIHSMSTAQEMDFFQEAEILSEQRHRKNNQDGDLPDLVLALLGRNR